MSVERVKAYLKQFGKDAQVQEFLVSSATVALAAQALGVGGCRIAKSITFKRSDEKAIMVVAAGDTKIDNGKFKAQFGLKAKMLSSDEALEKTGYAVGGVCPFDLDNTKVEVYLDVSLQRFDTVFPACGSSNSAIELTPQELFDLSNSLAWVDVCKFVELM